MGHLKRRIHSSLRTIMEIIIHNQCPLTLSARLWINIVLMAEEKPAIAISQQLGPAQEQRERRQQWVGVFELRLDVFVQPAQGSPVSKPRATTTSQTHSLAVAQGPPSPHPSPWQPLCPVKWKGSPVPAGNFPHGKLCTVQFA